MTIKSPRSLTLAFGLALAARLVAQDQTINGNLTVNGWIGATGAIDSDANALTFGTQSGGVGASFFYADDAEVIVDTGWADYVFDESYRLAPLSEVEAHIKTAKHLPGIPSAAEVAEHGVSMGQMQATLLSKVEELTLHLIAQEKELGVLKRQNQRLEQTLAELRAAQAH